MAVPHFVIDAPDGGGKIPLLPDGYLVQIDDQQVTLKNYEDKTFSYPQPQDSLVAVYSKNGNEANKQLTDKKLAVAHPYTRETNGHRPVSSRT